jgi:hypothetical protein
MLDPVGIELDEHNEPKDCSPFVCHPASPFQQIGPLTIFSVKEQFRLQPTDRAKATSISDISADKTPEHPAYLL